MSYTICPAKIEIYDNDLKQLAATIEVEDVCALVHVEKLLTTADDWVDFSSAVREGIKMLNLEMLE